MTGFNLTAEYEVVAADSAFVWIVDLNRGARSVTNDAERVCRKLNFAYPSLRIMYRDSEGQWDELVHEAGVFRGFKRGVPPP